MAKISKSSGWGRGWYPLYAWMSAYSIGCVERVRVQVQVGFRVSVSPVAHLFPGSSRLCLSGDAT